MTNVQNTHIELIFPVFDLTYITGTREGVTVSWFQLPMTVTIDETTCTVLSEHSEGEGFKYTIGNMELGVYVPRFALEDVTIDTELEKFKGNVRR